MDNNEKAVSFYDLKWDTDFFGVSSAKAILHIPLALNEWNKLQDKFKDYQFISIMNQNSDPFNTQLIGKDTAAFLVDVNIQFVKKLVDPCEIPTNITIHQSLERNDQIVELANFKFSKFTEDPELAKRGGDQVYSQWLINAFDKPDKFFALSRDENDDVDGFVLYSFSDNASVIELIAVSPKMTKGGIGTSLFKSVEYATHQQGFSEIKVGTQIRNIGAINFYHKVGCKQVGCHQVYHLWNL
ncbi:GNAT family N-acetyltransferase [Schinkia azotoformans]|uniref:GNAT family N-acetyltransferase n=1 Tax=Schinkia azotoformans TaxID=1454 RepID=UPI002DB7A29A|nr:GNAT family N-acetyltransferase [Schinkia azotoformans]MEC1771901.1 GNAT family N-acetyltransferase [Schinkia azotoformans]MED4366399.1 GNAT family N-acetyltransferase [Schinkia azotoformans]